MHLNLPAYKQKRYQMDLIMEIHTDMFPWHIGDDEDGYQHAAIQLEALINDSILLPSCGADVMFAVDEEITKLGQAEKLDGLIHLTRTLLRASTAEVSDDDAIEPAFLALAAAAAAFDGSVLAIYQIYCEQYEHLYGAHHRDVATSVSDSQSEDQSGGESDDECPKAKRRRKVTRNDLSQSNANFVKVDRDGSSRCAQKSISN